MSDESLFITPNRETRRDVAGRPCCACDVPLKQSEVFGVRTDEAILWFHEACVSALLRQGAETGESDE